MTISLPIQESGWCPQRSREWNSSSLLNNRLQRAVFCLRRCSLAFMISFMAPRWPNLENVAIGQRRMLADELYSVIHVPRLKDENAAQLFLGFA
jgi:hypothetical protein